MSKELVAQVSATIAAPEFQSKIAAALPANVSVDRFTRCLLTAWQINPDILSCERTSLYMSVLTAAQQGLMPDGREGVIVKFSVKVGEKWIDKAQFMPMVAGVIKRFADAGVSVYAGSVYSADQFRAWNDDTGQHVLHTPVHFGERGEWLGCYAVATVNGSTYVEIAGIPEIQKIRSKSKGAFDRNGDLKGPWLDWPERMGQKSLLHRLGRRVPLPVNSDAAERLARTVNADREEFEDIPQAEPERTVTPVSEPRTRPAVFDRLAPEPVTDAATGSQAPIQGQTQEPDDF